MRSPEPIGAVLSEAKEGSLQLFDFAGQGELQRSFVALRMTVGMDFSADSKGAASRPPTGWSSL
jgi:hypothetical protein